MNSASWRIAAALVPLDLPIDASPRPRASDPLNA